MEKHIEILLRRVSYGSMSIATFILVLLILQTPETCVLENAPKSTKFPKSSCDSSHRQHLPLEKKNHRLWSSKSWNRQVNSYAHLFRQLQQNNLLFNHSKVLCVSAGAGHEVMAFNNVGVADVTGVELMDSPPLVSRADPHNLPFFDDVFDVAFTAHLAEALFPSRFVAEMERTVRNDGVCMVLMEQCDDREVKDIVALFRKSRFVDAINVTVNGSKMTRILMRRSRI
ncbi:S-adenosyl-L-methionine-dependent methyltransferase-like protein [Melia azedarach]|uniref:S-adenosyl-L-methionine-dependent methyltransferase-like protein n=1 Tax=Melia azedarach TaxID=155640 RepID=A0ACC1Z3A4_MELAZ|nr:S-adenosyl-L-methionine-dependent methyltransferase-like protein [Melia azedarach]